MISPMPAHVTFDLDGREYTGVYRGKGQFAEYRYHVDCPEVSDEMWMELNLADELREVGGDPLRKFITLCLRSELAFKLANRTTA
jgi:hypothetical protein